MTGIEVGVAVIVGVLLGRFLPNRRKGPKARGPVCGCTHHRSFHDEKGCSARVREKGIDGWLGDTRTCPCRQYSGPEPLPEYYAPELATGDPT
jgi:hypothetical protein